MKRKTSLLWIAALLCFLLGTACILFPFVAQSRYKQNATSIAANFDERWPQGCENNGTSNGYEWLYFLLQSYNRLLFEDAQGNLTDSSSYETVDFSMMALGFEDELFGYLEIPQLDSILPVYLGAGKENLAQGAAHLTNTSIPIGGENTNAVIAAHRGMGTARMLRDVEQLELGDEVLFTNFRETLRYVVSDIQVIAPTDKEKILIQPGKDMLTLVTCHPFPFNYQRYVVYCERN